MAIGQLHRAGHNGTYGGYNDTLPVVEGTATPLARRIARINGIALRSIAGSGGNGRIVLRDLVPNAAAVRAFEPPIPPSIEAAGLLVDRPFHLTVRCQVDRLLALCADVNANLNGRGITVSLDDMLIRAMAVAMAAVPAVNVQREGDAVRRLGPVAIAMAVTTGGGLALPVLRAVDTLSVAAIASARRAAMERASDGASRPQEHEDAAAAAIFDLGRFGIDEGVLAIAPPQALALGVGAVIEQPWKVDGAVGLAHIVRATASFDRRAIDDADGAEFLAAFRSAVEDPLGMLA